MNAETAGSVRTILLIDDDVPVRRVISRMLERCGYHVLGAGGGSEAIDIFRGHQAEVACILLDLFMPQMDGREALQQLRAIRPDVPVILTSGCDEGSLQDPEPRRTATRFIQKPFVLESLQQVLREALRPSGAGGA